MSTITFAGHLAADPEWSVTSNGRRVVLFTVLESQHLTLTGQGWQVAEPIVYRVQVGGSFAVNVLASCRSGDRVHVTGRIVTERWLNTELGVQCAAQHIQAEEVSFSLRDHTVHTTTSTRNNTQAREAEEVF